MLAASPSSQPSGAGDATSAGSSSTQFFAKGYLLKRNRDHTTSNVLGSMAKYKRRWVELTTATLVYCPTQLDVLTGQLQVFAVADMIWVRAEADTKFQVKFPERSLKFKVAGGRVERDQWLEALKAAKQHHAAAEQERRSGAGRLEHLQKALLPPEPSITSDPSTTGGHMAVHHLASESGSVGLCSAAGGRGSMPGLGFTASSIGASMHEDPSTSGGQQQRPPSPRTLLASARAGMALVNSMSPAGTPRAQAAASARPAPAQQQSQQHRHFFVGESGGPDSDDADSSDEEGSSDAEDTTQQQQEEQQQRQREEGSTAASGAVTDHNAGAGLAVEVDSQDTASGHEGPASASHHPGLARRITPGVLLTSSRPTTPASCTGLQQHHSLAASSHDTTATASPASTAAASPRTAAGGGARAPPAPLDDDDCVDDVLRLDAAAPSTSQAQASAQARALAQRLLQQTLGSRPASPLSTSSTASAGGLTPSDVFSAVLSRPASGSSSRSRVGESAPLPVLHAVQQPEGGARHSSPGGAATDSLEDAILRLGVDEVLSEGTTSIQHTASSISSHHYQHQQQHEQYQQQLGTLSLAATSGGGWQGSSSSMNSNSRPGALQVPLVGSRPGSAAATGSRPGSAASPGSRPGSAAAAATGYRPGTPLKSCLRNSPGSNPTTFNSPTQF